LEQCKGSIPVGDESVDVEWTKNGEDFAVILSLPEGYNYGVVPTTNKVNVVLK
jgi:hypothetical protein